MPFRRTRTGVTLQRARTLLVVKPDEIGDVVLATGFLCALRTECSQARIVVAVRASAASLIAVPEMADEVILWHEEWRSWPFGFRAWHSLFCAARKRFHAAPPDWAIIPRGSGDHRMMSVFAWWSGATRICAHAQFCSEWGLDRSALVNELVPDAGPTHETDLHARMLTYLGLAASDCRPVLPRLPATPSAFATGDRSRIQIALGIGAGDASRRWPVERFRKLIEAALERDLAVAFVIIGGPADQASGETLAALPRVVNLAGKTSLLETAAALRECRVYVGNDSGPMHLAAAAGCGIVAISKHPLGGSDASANSPVRFRPVASRTRILQPRAAAALCATSCNADEPHCILGIAVEEVLAAMEDLLRLPSPVARRP